MVIRLNNPQTIVGQKALFEILRANTKEDWPYIKKTFSEIKTSHVLRLGSKSVCGQRTNHLLSGDLRVPL
jgi:hypothetical protein